MDIDARTKLLLKDDFYKLKNIKIAIIGLGGVGSIIPLVLVRTGIKKLVIIDKDKVEASNLNRQMAYTLKDIGKYKSEALKEKLFEIQDDIEINNYSKCIDDDFDFSCLENVDYIIDCIDDIKAKVKIAKFAYNKNIPLIVSLGMGNRIDPSLVKITKLNKTCDDPLARKYRYLLRQENIDISNVDVAFSYEKPIIKDKIISSIVFVPNSAGLNIGGYVIKKIIGW